MKNETAIQVKGLKKEYKEGFWRRKRLVLDNVSFQVPAGQIFGFLGANGAGKTTTIKVAMGLQTANAGTVEIFGRSYLDAEARHRVGFLPERPYFHMNLSANEFLDFHRNLYGSELSGRSRQSNEDLFKIVGLQKVGNRLLRAFSKGMLQRIGIAQALINDPDLVILDEPMSGLDPVGRREVRNLMLDLNRAGKTVFFSSHILSDIESVCQQIAFLEKGVLKYHGKIEDLIANDAQDFEILFRLDQENVRREMENFGALQVSGKQLRLMVKGAAEARRAVEKAWLLGAEISSFGHVHRSLEEILFGEKGLGNAGNFLDRS